MKIPKKRREKYFKKNLTQLFYFLALTLSTIFLASCYFDLGDQIYPIKFNKKLAELRNPECRRLRNVQIQYEDGSMRFFIRSENNYVSRNFQVYKLFRFFINGPLYTEEIRGIEENGLYTLNEGQNITLAIHYDMTQTGNLSVDIYCIDELFGEASFVSSSNNLPQSRKRSMIDENYDVTNVCQTRDEDLFFTYANMRNTTDFMFHNPNARFVPMTISAFATEKGSEFGFLQSCALLDAYDQSPLNIIQNVLVGALLSNRPEVKYGINVPSNDRNIEGYIMKITKKGFIYELDRESQKFCWSGFKRTKTRYPINDISDESVHMVRDILFGKLMLSKKIVTNIENISISKADGYRIVSLNGRSITDKMEVIKNAKFLIIEDDGTTPALATLLQKDAVAIIKQNKQQVKGVDVPVNSEAIKFARKADCKLEFTIFDDFDDIISKYL